MFNQKTTTVTEATKTNNINFTNTCKQGGAWMKYYANKNIAECDIDRQEDFDTNWADEYQIQKWQDDAVDKTCGNDADMAADRAPDLAEDHALEVTEKRAEVISEKIADKVVDYIFDREYKTQMDLQGLLQKILRRELINALEDEPQATEISSRVAKKLAEIKTQTGVEGYDFWLEIITALTNEIFAVIFDEVREEMTDVIFKELKEEIFENFKKEILEEFDEYSA